MSLEVLVVVALAAAGLCWLLLVSPELPSAGRALKRRWSSLFHLEQVSVDLAQAELTWISPQAWVEARIGLALAAALLGYVVFGLFVIALVCAIAAYYLLGLTLETRRRQVEARRQRALLDAIRYGVAVMSRSGSATQMLQALAKGGPFEAQPTFQQLVDEAGSGEVSLTQATSRLRERLADPLFDDLSLALILHWKRGGKLVPALEALVDDWEETLRLQQDAKAVRAGVQASVLLLTLLPFAFLFMIHGLAPELLRPLERPAGEIVFAIAVGWMVIGYRVLQEMSRPPREERISFSEAAL